MFELLIFALQQKDKEMGMIDSVFIVHLTCGRTKADNTYVWWKTSKEYKKQSHWDKPGHHRKIINADVGSQIATVALCNRNSRRSPVICRLILASSTPQQHSSETYWLLTNSSNFKFRDESETQVSAEPLEGRERCPGSRRSRGSSAKGLRKVKGDRNSAPHWSRLLSHITHFSELFVSLKHVFTVYLLRLPNPHLYGSSSSSFGFSDWGRDTTQGVSCLLCLADDAETSRGKKHIQVSQKTDTLDRSNWIIAPITPECPLWISWIMPPRLECAENKLRSSLIVIDDTHIEPEQCKCLFRV